MEGLSARSFADALDYLNEGKASRTVSQKIQAAYGIEDLRSQMDVLAGLVVNANELLAAAKEDPLTANYPPVLQSLVDSVNTVTLFSAWTPIAQALGNQNVRLALDGTVGILLMRSGQDETSAPALSEFLDNVRDRTQTLLDEVRDASDIDDDLRDLIVDHLGDVVVAVAEARAGRLDRLRSASSEGVGQLALRPDLGRTAQGHPVLGAVVNLLTYLSLIATPLGLAADTIALNEAMSQPVHIEMVVIEAPSTTKALPKAPDGLPPGDRAIAPPAGGTGEADAVGEARD